MYVLNNQSLDRKILETDPNLYLTFYEVDLYCRYFMKKKKSIIRFPPPPPPPPQEISF